MKKFLWVFLLAGMISCSSDKQKNGNLIDFIPDNASVIVRTTSLETLGSDLKNNSFLATFSKTGLYNYFSHDILLTDYLKPVSEVLMGFSTNDDSTYNYTIISRMHPKLFILDSLRDKKVETLNYEGYTLQKITIDEGILFSNITDSVFIASNSEENLKNIITRYSETKKSNKGGTFEKIYAAGASQPLTIFINGKNFPQIFSRFLPDSGIVLNNFASWMALDAHIYPDQIKINGIAIARDTTPQLLDVFKGTLPQKNELAYITPPSASGFISYTYSDFERLYKNLLPFQKDREEKNIHEQFFQSLNEIGIIYKENKQIIGLHAIDGNVTAESLLPLQNSVGEFRDVVIMKLNDSLLFTKTLKPLITDSNPAYFARLNDFFVFTETTGELEEVIIQYLNETTLGHQPYYKEHVAQLSSESSILLVNLISNSQDKLSRAVSGSQTAQIKDMDFSSHPVTALQLVYDTNFAHVNGVVKESKNGKRSAGISQQFAIKLENALLSRPQFFANHLSKGKDIVVQDVANKLYLISSDGRVLWNKQLEGPILGEIQEVDMLKNGRYQLAFVTKNNFYILDRNGKEVPPFALKFKDAITQPLSVFDYDSNKDYRFIVTQGSSILMYDSKGKSVSGFSFKKAGSAVALPPQHLRIGKNDYIVIAEENGKLNILHRTGASRISVSEKFDFSQTPVFMEDGKFVFLTEGSSKVTITEQGKLTTQKLESATTPVMTISGKTKVTLDDNILRINSHRIELPFGVYTSPKISVSNRRVLVSITDLQQQRVYVYNSLGELLPNFPVYGTSVMEMADATNNGRPNGVVKGEDTGVILYDLN